MVRCHITKPFPKIKTTNLEETSTISVDFHMITIKFESTDDEGECTVSSFSCIFIYANQTSYLTIKMSKAQR